MSLSPLLIKQFFHVLYLTRTNKINIQRTFPSTGVNRDLQKYLFKNTYQNVLRKGKSNHYVLLTFSVFCEKSERN